MTIRVFLTWQQYFFIWEALGGGLWRAGEGAQGIIRLGSNLLLPSAGPLPAPTPLPRYGRPQGLGSTRPATLTRLMAPVAEGGYVSC